MAEHRRGGGMTSARQWTIAVARALSPDMVPQRGVPLAEFQAQAASRLTQIVREWGGALLADGVGLGKTRVALTAAAAIARNQRMASARGPVWFCVPARTVASWRRALAESDLDDTVVVSHASLSRGHTPAQSPIMVVVDEAHRFRNPGTKRRRTLSRVADVPILLVTATPITNSLDDIWNLLSLFVDSDDLLATFGLDLNTAWKLSKTGGWDLGELLQETTVRRTSPPTTVGFGRRPDARVEVLLYEPSDDEAWLWANLERELRALTLMNDWPTGLFVEHVLRRWESGPQALLETLRELESYAERQQDAHRRGTALTRAHFKSLFGVNPQQEVMEFLYPKTTAELATADIESDRERLQALFARVERICRGGRGRDEAIAAMVSQEKLLVFTSYRRAAHALFDLLVRRQGHAARVGLITGSEALATGLGRTTAADVLSRFSPISHGRLLRHHEMLDVLVATDCVSEGVNLQDCGRIVLADLPYTPLGVEQRVGRLMRPGGPHDQIRVYLPRPARWNDSLGMRRRLQAKIDTADEVGLAPTELLGDVSTNPFDRFAALEAIAALPAEEIALLRAATATDRPQVWLVLAQINQRHWFFATPDDIDFVATLSELAWSEEPLRICEVPDSVRCLLNSRETLLRAAIEAPPSLQLDSPEAVAWRRIVSQPHDLSTEQLLALRDKLLRGHRLGVRRRISTLLRSGSTTQLLRYVRTLPQCRREVSVSLVACLGISREQALRRGV